ncbi:hypothetical protein ACFR9U_12055 [Halorientalis brevis]|uniref:Uncharacterized protein n=1 Tax=Halorientalis brevis TaxID=1126241 RepID=A0ABD6CED6_9EURY|nr:hypothetical protein [Halorientalis brevis]
MHGNSITAVLESFGVSETARRADVRAGGGHGDVVQGRPNTSTYRWT